MFDLENIPAAATLFEKAAAGTIQLTPPPKAVLEEKLWLALLWNRNLHDFWRQQLGDGFLRRLQPGLRFHTSPIPCCGYGSIIPARQEWDPSGTD